MVAAFPLAKIGLLLLKQLSKPMANIIKNRAKKHPSVRKYVIIPTGRAYNWVEQQTLILKGEVTEPAKLTDEEIVELGSNAIGEIILFGLLTLILLAEYTRQGDKKAAIQQMKEDEIGNLVSTVLETIEDVNNLKKTVQKLQDSLKPGKDAIEMEEERHPVIYDNDFLDVMLRTRRKFVMSRLVRKPKPHDQEEDDGSTSA